jgi:hypothetical protein
MVLQKFNRKIQKFFLGDGRWLISGGAVKPFGIAEL